MGSLVKLFDVVKPSTTLFRVCSVLYPQFNRSLAEVKTVKEKKRPASAFASFFREKQPSLKERYPDLNQTELMKMASNLWSTEDFSIKQQYKNEFIRRMEDYKEEMKVPKRPPPPYLRFYQENNSSLQWSYPNITERAKEAGRMWKALSDYEREQYRIQYTQEMNDYHKNLTDHEKDLIQQKKAAIQQQRRRRDLRRFGKVGLSEKPKAPGNNAYCIFISMHSSEVPKDQNVFQYLSQKWSNLSEMEKDIYREKFNVALQGYHKDLEEWVAKYDKQAK